ncbi:ABC transporter ATP-binding protein [Plantactinospora endophytica]|uniref:Daunorubicin resistance protein DrrA family ABC transporter ATP-binding protein n=1 Tax=Plantactinospora endophytica TaxID=673535 RepID=A0ABQ4EEH6_9ACTN|nr:ABC transporter ATP-binding protein [Plantactinospora endophytica]GIG93132.1 daunorubicin resistance protein DrrA family ABC transporter ATP-binding protein [Plantactinospora endophytica]
MVDQTFGLQPAVDARSLGRTYVQRRRLLGPPVGEVTALGGVDLRIGEGELHGLLGPNGAGKTTMCKILSTVLTPSSGSIRIFGLDVVRDAKQLRPLIGIVMGGERGLYYKLTAREYLRYWAALYGVDTPTAARRAGELLDRLGLGKRADHRIETYSRGMKQRLHLARGLVTDPRLLLLDEPTSGLDPLGARAFRALIGELRQDRTILLTTHDMVEAEQLCDRVTLIDNGRVIATESPSTLSTRLTRFERVDAQGVDDTLLAKLADVSGVSGAGRRPDGSVRVETAAKDASGQVLRMLLDAGVTRVRTSLPDLEEVYVHLVDGQGAARR